MKKISALLASFAAVAFLTVGLVGCSDNTTKKSSTTTTTSKDAKAPGGDATKTETTKTETTKTEKKD